MHIIARWCLICQASVEARKIDNKPPKITDKDITGLKYFHKLDGLLEQLHDVGCEADKAGNRMLVLLYLFNPIVSSLRGVQQASDLKKVQKKLGCPRASLGSLSESVTVFDPERLKPIIEGLAEKLKPVSTDQRLKDITGLTLVDGSIVEALPRISMASLREQQSGSSQELKWTLHTFFEVDRYVPTRMKVTPTGGGDCDERAVMSCELFIDRTYVMDRGYAKFKLFNQIAGAKSSYVCRIRDNSIYEVLQQRSLTGADRAARVLSEKVISLGSQSGKSRPDHRVRLIVIKAKLHKSKGCAGMGSTGQDCDGYLRIATNLMDVLTDVIALIYHYRWTIEIFFRFFKHVLGCRHLLSHSQNGIEIQVYCAIIACMLISLGTRRKPTLRIHEMIC